RKARPRRRPSRSTSPCSRRACPAATRPSAPPRLSRRGAGRHALRFGLACIATSSSTVVACRAPLSSRQPPVNLRKRAPKPAARRLPPPPAGLVRRARAQSRRLPLQAAHGVEPDAGLQARVHRRGLRGRHVVLEASLERLERGVVEAGAQLAHGFPALRGRVE